MEIPSIDDCGRDVVVDLPDGGNLIAPLILLDARPESLEFGIRGGMGIHRLSTFAGWRFAK